MGNKIVPADDRKIKVSLYLNKRIVLDLKDKKVNLSEIVNNFLLSTYKK